MKAKPFYKIHNDRIIRAGTFSGKPALVSKWLLPLSVIVLLGGCVDQSPKQAQDTVKDEIHSVDNKKFPQKFHVEGNKIVDEAGQEVILRGLTPMDPVTLVYNNESGKFIPFSEEIFKKMSEWGAEIVRLPIGPFLWRKHGKEKVFAVIDQCIEWSAKYGMYVYIDYQCIGFPPTENYENQWCATTKPGMLNFWDETSKYYRDNNFVAFYELFNEPKFSGKYPPTEESLGKDWMLWKEFAEEVIDVIRKNDPDSVIMVGGLVWAHDISFAEKNPIERENIVYAVHPYPGTLIYSKKTWDEAFGNVQKKYPVYATEFGYSLENFLKIQEVREKIIAYVPSVERYRKEAEANKGNPEYQQKLWAQAQAEIYGNEQAREYIARLEKEYETKIKSYLDDRGIGWTAWIFDVEWNTRLLKDRNYTPTHSGEFIREWLLEKKSNKNQ